MNFTLLSASYSVATFNATKGHAVMVNGGHKLLVIHYSIENPNSQDMYVTSWPLFQAVDTKDTTIPDSGETRRVQDKEGLSVSLKPGQELADLVTYITVPSDTFVPKLIFRYAPVGKPYKVIRYMLGTKPNVIKPLVAPYVDTSDKSGSVALEKVPAVTGTTYKSGFCDLVAESISLAPGPFGSTQAGDGKQFVVVKLTGTNKAWAHVYFNGAYRVALKTEDDKLTDFTLLKGSADEGFQGTGLDTDDSTTHRIVIPVSKNAKLKTLSISIDMGNDGVTRQFVYDVSGLK